MKCLRVLILLLALVPGGCILSNLGFPSPDCSGNVPAGFTRIFIGFPAPRGTQSGTTADDPLDGSTAEKFDTILRSIAEGQHPTWGTQKNIQPEDLIVCIAKGTFATNGFDHFAPGDPQAVPPGGVEQAQAAGFSVGKNWKIHGHGAKKTTLKLAVYVPQQFTNSDGSLIDGGANVIIANRSFDASGVEVSDLTLDANHDGLTGPGGTPLNLSAIVLRTVDGRHRLHDFNVIGASGDLGSFDISHESFVVQLWGEPTTSGESANRDNLVENVAIGRPGKPIYQGEFPGGKMDGIVINNATAEVRHNLVEGAFIGYGGWQMNEVNFHDNIARNTGYGFNADSLPNLRVTLKNTQIIHPAFYGAVIGGARPGQEFSEWMVSGNTIVLGASGSTGIVLLGQVFKSTFSGNTITSDRPITDALGIWSLPSVHGLLNISNIFQQNKLDRSLPVNFSDDPNFNSDCRFLNRDLHGNTLPGFADNSSTLCSQSPAQPGLQLFAPGR